MLFTPWPMKSIQELEYNKAFCHSLVTFVRFEQWGHRCLMERSTSTCVRPLGAVRCSHVGVVDSFPLLTYVVYRICLSHPRLVRECVCGGVGPEMKWQFLWRCLMETGRLRGSPLPAWPTRLDRALCGLRDQRTVVFVSVLICDTGLVVTVQENKRGERLTI